MPKKKFTPAKKDSSVDANVLTSIKTDTRTKMSSSTKNTMTEKQLKQYKRRRTRLFVESWRFYKAKFWRFTNVAIVVMFSAAMLESYQNRYGSPADLTFILYAAGVMCFLSLVWLNINHTEADKLKIIEVYNSANSRFLPFLMVSVLQSLMMLPLIFGIFLFIISVSLGMTIWMQVLAVVLGLISIVFLLWYSQAVFAVLEEGTTSFAALRVSQRIVKGRVRTIVVDYFFFALAVAILIVVVGKVSSFIPWIQNNWVVEGIVSGILLTVIFSLASIFGYNVYQDVKKQYVPPVKQPRKVIKTTS